MRWSAPLARKHDEFVSQLDDARTRLAKAAAVSAVVATILQGPQTYLVLASNNAEMRAGSGAFLEVGTADTVGRLGPPRRVRPEWRADARPRPGPRSPATSSGTGDGSSPGVDWRNLGLTPQFDVTAALAARMWAARTGQQVDGVLAVDVAGLRQILTATGPVEAGGRDRRRRQRRAVPPARPVRGTVRQLGRRTPPGRRPRRHRRRRPAPAAGPVDRPARRWPRPWPAPWPGAT